MPRRSPDDPTLLAHAREVFLDRGVSARASDVAARAGVSEALLFKRFGTREGMFASAMADEFSIDKATWLRDLEDVSGVGEVQTNLVQVGVDAITYFERMMPVVMMTWSALPKQVLTDHASPDAAPFASRRRVEAWFETERRLGRIADCDTELVARIYLGSLYNHASWQVTLGPMDPRPLGRGAFVRGLVAVLWRGLDPARPEGAADAL